jgi:hypothetical protein
VCVCVRAPTSELEPGRRNSIWKVGLLACHMPVNQPRSVLSVVEISHCTVGESVTTSTCPEKFVGGGGTRCWCLPFPPVQHADTGSGSVGCSVQSNAVMYAGSECQAPLPPIPPPASTLANKKAGAWFLPSSQSTFGTNVEKGVMKHFGLNTSCREYSGRFCDGVRVHLHTVLGLGVACGLQLAPRLWGTT